MLVLLFIFYFLADVFLALIFFGFFLADVFPALKAKCFGYVLKHSIFEKKVALSLAKRVKTVKVLWKLSG